MRLLTHPDVALGSRCELVSSFDAELKRLVDQMLDVMYAGDGIGLAASQVGVLKSVIIVDPSAGERADECMIMVNPTYVPTTMHRERGQEGCLSLPGVKAWVDRWTDVSVTYQDLSGNHVQRVLSGLAARIVQHEHDHLIGKTLLDHMGRTKR